MEQEQVKLDWLEQIEQEAKSSVEREEEDYMSGKTILRLLPIVRAAQQLASANKAKHDAVYQFNTNAGSEDAVDGSELIEAACLDGLIAALDAAERGA